MSDESSTDKAGIRPHGWGVIVGTLWVFVAFIGPQFLVSGLVPFIKNLNVGSDTKLFVLEALTELIILAVILLVIKFYSSSLKDIGLLAKLTVRDLGLVLICFPLYLLTSGILSEVIGRLFPGLNLLDQQQIGFHASQVPEMVLVFIALVIIPPFVEETVFRGFLFKAYRRRFGFVWASLLVSFWFAIAHAPIGVSIDVFALSLYLCYVRDKTGSLWASILLHSLKNLVAFVFLFIIPTR